MATRRVALSVAGGIARSGLLSGARSMTVACQAPRLAVPSAARRIPVSRSARLAGAVRAYSQQPGEGSKIWNFEDIQELVKNPNPDIIIVDTREPGELQQTGKIPQALNIPITTSPDSFFISEEEFEDRFGYPRPAKDTEVVFYCKAGVRSRAAATIAREAGWTKVGEYPGSFVDWDGKGGKIER